MTHGFSISIPTPPSVNNLFANSKRGGRHKTRAYRAWTQEAGWIAKGQKPEPVLGEYTYCLTLPKIPSSSDPDNRVKAALDLLVSLKLVEGDSIKFCQGGTVMIDAARPPGMAEIRVCQPDKHGE